MILRRIKAHIEKENWFAVFIDFCIVVIGVFIGIQVANWNEARAVKVQETAILDQLKSEFTEIKDALEKQISIREQYVADIESLVTGLEGTGPIPDDTTIKRALMAVRSTGRRPAESAAYLQLTASGTLARLSNDELKQALIQYHARLERDAFIFPVLIQLVYDESTSNKFIDYNISAAGVRGAAIDGEPSEEAITNRIRSYDWDGLRAYEERYELIHSSHDTLVDTDRAQLSFADKILKLISESRGQ